MYVAVKGGEKAIQNAHRLLAERRRGDPDLPELSTSQIRQQLWLAVDRVMAEASLYDPDLAALAVKQAGGDLVEAAFLLRAFRTTLPRLAQSRPLDTETMNVFRRISATFKDIPGGQILGPTFDYTHRLLEFDLENQAPASPTDAPSAPHAPAPPGSFSNEETSRPIHLPKVTGLLAQEDLIEQEIPREDAPVGDITRQPLTFPANRDVRLQSLARADEGFLLALGYSVQRGFGNNHPFVGEIRMGKIPVKVEPEGLGFEIEIGEITVTECDMINQFKGSKSKPAQFTRGYGLVLGENERKAMSMALVDRALRARELDEDMTAPAQDEEFVLYHGDNVEASGFVTHLKLPHHVDFQTELVMVRQMRAQAEKENLPDNQVPEEENR